MDKVAIKYNNAGKIRDIRVSLFRWISYRSDKKFSFMDEIHDSITLKLKLRGLIKDLIKQAKLQEDPEDWNIEKRETDKVFYFKINNKEYLIKALNT